MILDYEFDVTGGDAHTPHATAGSTVRYLAARRTAFESATQELQLSLAATPSAHTVARRVEGCSCFFPHRRKRRQDTCKAKGLTKVSPGPKRCHRRSEMAP